MSTLTREQEFLNEQEALARAGIERAVRALCIDVMDALSLPTRLREHEVFEIATAVAAKLMSHDATLTLIGASLLGGSSRPHDLREIVRRACVDSVLALTTCERSNSAAR